MRAINPEEHALSFLSKVIAISQPAIRSLLPEDSYPTIAKGSPHPTKRNRCKVEVVNPNRLGINELSFSISKRRPTVTFPSQKHFPDQEVSRNGNGGPFLLNRLCFNLIRLSFWIKI
jgi:hypothetical protein